MAVHSEVLAIGAGDWTKAQVGEETQEELLSSMSMFDQGL